MATLAEIETETGRDDDVDNGRQNQTKREEPLHGASSICASTGEKDGHTR